MQIKLSRFTKRSYGTQTFEFIFSTNQTSRWDEYTGLGETSHRDVWLVEYAHNPFARSVGTFRAEATNWFAPDAVLLKNNSYIYLTVN